jgi:hypothetical protein
MEITANKHQAALLSLIMERTEISWFFLIGGYGCGKSFTDVMLCLWIHGKYKSFVNVGILGTSQKELKQTILMDLENTLIGSGIKYEWNKTEGWLQIGNTRYTYLSMEVPERIKAHNFNISIVDEIGEMPKEEVWEIIKAVRERTRKVLPDGRKPFTVLTTTAQGLDGTWRLINRLKETGIKYIKVRGESWANPYIDRSQLEDLSRMYTKEEYEAFILGKFVNLASGRVYPEFTEGRDVYMEFPLDDDVIIGGDFNSGYNMSVAMIERNGVLYVIEEFGVKVVGFIPEEARKRYKRRITLVPDASGKEILRGYIKECEINKVELHMQISNPGITERTLVVNKLFRMGRLKVFKRCKKLIEGLSVRGFDEDGKPEKGRGFDAVDHVLDALEYGVYYWAITNKGCEEMIAMLMFMGKKEGNRGKTLSMEEFKRYNNYRDREKEE